MDLEKSLWKFELLKEYADAKKQLRDLCFATCDCGYILPEPNWEHRPACTFMQAYKELIK